MHSPPESREYQNPDKDDRVPCSCQLRSNVEEQSELTVHDRNRHRVGVRKAEENIEEDNQDTSYAVDHKPGIAHPERPFGRVLPLAQEMRQDC